MVQCDAVQYGIIRYRCKRKAPTGSMISCIPRVLCLGTRMSDPCVHVVFWAPISTTGPQGSTMELLGDPG